MFYIRPNPVWEPLTLNKDTASVQWDKAPTWHTWSQIRNFMLHRHCWAKELECVCLESITYSPPAGGPWPGRRWGPAVCIPERWSRRPPLKSRGRCPWTTAGWGRSAGGCGLLPEREAALENTSTPRVPSRFWLGVKQMNEKSPRVFSA